MNLRKILGLVTAQEKISEYRELKQKLAALNAIGGELTGRFMIQKSIMEDSEFLPEAKRGEVLGRYNDFLKEHQKEVTKAMNDRIKIIKSMERLKNDEEISEAIANIDALDNATQYYRQGRLSKAAYFDIVKSLSGEPVKYADVIVRDTAGRVLILHRVEGFIPTGKVCLPGGHVDPGEDFQTAALRELKEETNLDPVKDKGIIELGEYKSADAHIKYYEVYVDSLQPVTVDACEHCFSEWIEVPEMAIKPFIFDQGKIALNLLLQPQQLTAVEPLMKALSNGHITPEAFVPGFNMALTKAMDTEKEEPLAPESMDGDTKEPLEKSKVIFAVRDKNKTVDKILKAVSGCDKVTIGKAIELSAPVVVYEVNYQDKPESNRLTAVDVVYAGDKADMGSLLNEIRFGLMLGNLPVKTPHEEFMAVNEYGTDYVGEPVFVDVLKDL